MFTNTKLERARKRRTESVQPVECQTKLRRTSLEGQLINDGKLLARLSGGDAIAQELKYYFACLTDLYNRERTYLRATKKLEQEHAPEEDVHPQAFSELVETTRSGEGPAVFRLADIVHLYAQRLEQLGVDAPAVNPTRLKEKLLSEIPELEAYKQGRDVLLAFQKDVGFVLSEAFDY